MTLRVFLEEKHPAVLRAAWQLARGWRTEVGEEVRLHGTAPGPHVRLRLGSLVRPSVVVCFEVPYEAARAVDADRLALSTAAWDSFDDVEPWRELSAPLETISHLGTPRWSDPWAVACSPPKAALSSSEQLHILGGFPAPPRGAVWWPSLPTVAAAVLGRAEHVLGRSDPLVFDAWRAGIAVRAPDGTELGDIDLGGALAGLVPPSLIDEPALWRHVARTAHETHQSGAPPEPLMTPKWVALGRDRIRERLAAPPSRWEQLRRRRDKLRRDPKRFFADSRYSLLRRIGRIAFDE